MTESPGELPLRCRCGEVRGTASGVAATSGFHFVCYCTDCQRFARFLGRNDVLDSAGGTEIFQMPIGRVELIAGTDKIRCVRYSRKVHRRYTDCCRTPIGNTAGPRFPVIGLIHWFKDHGADGRSRDDLLGAKLCRICQRSATAPLPPDAPPPLSLAFFPRRAATLLGWWWRGLARPNPFFDDTTGAPISAPHDFR
jgi:hypothetical protein